MMMKKKVTRIEAIIIMRAAKEFREKQEMLAQLSPEPVAVPELIIEPVVSTKKSILTYVIDFFRKKGT